ncbi:hypothetical protein JCM19237_3052 [Photobacterium aphoticum]|uniref:Uncharacterized protein n=1 Tax=Photobacterium aphoticum TaxID=754436 RepID=A0A090RHQ2_9GAMM|nr:hypothetical protein JCM19237_3052 [Photobacterium aphoticum]
MSQAFSIAALIKSCEVITFPFPVDITVEAQPGYSALLQSRAT